MCARFRDGRSTAHTLKQRASWMKYVSSITTLQSASVLPICRTTTSSARRDAEAQLAVRGASGQWRPQRKRESARTVHVQLHELGQHVAGVGGGYGQLHHAVLLALCAGVVAGRTDLCNATQGQHSNRKVAVSTGIHSWMSPSGWARSSIKRSRAPAPPRNRQPKRRTY